MKKSVFVVMPYGLKEVRPYVPAKADTPESLAVNVNFDEIYDQLISPALTKQV